MMSPGDRPICMTVKTALASMGPLSCGDAFYQSSVLARPKWSYLDPSELLSIARRLEVLMEPPAQRESPWPNSAQFTEQATARIQARTLTVALTTVTLAGFNKDNMRRTADGENTTILRYQRWGCSELQGTTAPRVVYFLIKKPDLSDLAMLNGLGTPDDLFMIDGLAYFDSRSEREVDSHWKPLAHPQPELDVHEMVGENTFVQICRLVYWDTDRKKN